MSNFLSNLGKTETFSDTDGNEQFNFTLNQSYLTRLKKKPLNKLIYIMGHLKR